MHPNEARITFLTINAAREHGAFLRPAVHAGHHMAFGHFFNSLPDRHADASAKIAEPKIQNGNDASTFWCGGVITPAPACQKMPNKVARLGGSRAATDSGQDVSGMHPRAASSRPRTLIAHYSTTAKCWLQGVRLQHRESLTRRARSVPPARRVAASAAAGAAPAAQAAAAL